jgi:CSLREA domain-containing protein
MKSANNLLTKRGILCLRVLAVVISLVGFTALNNMLGASAKQAVTAEKIAFENSRDGNAGIYVLNAGSADQTPIINNPAFDGEHVWETTTPTSSGCVTPPSDMVAWFPGDGNAYDIQGGGYHGIVNGGVTFPAGKVAQAFQFDGTSNVFYPTINAGAAYTVDFWVRPTRTGAFFEHLISNNGGNSQNSFGTLRYDANFNRVQYIRNFAASVESGAGTVPPNTYTHIALTFDGSVNRLYINGALAQTSAVHTETFNNPIYVGFTITNPNGELSFVGQIDEVEIFSRALSPAEIQSIVAADSEGKCKPAPQPMTYVVNTTSDTSDGACDSAHCSLREAILAANANAALDTITFNIPGAGVQTINVNSTGLGALPPINNPVNINGYTQPGSAVNTATDGSTNALPLIELNGQALTNSSNNTGLLLRPGSDNSAVRGLVINSFNDSISSVNPAGIYVQAHNIFIGGCFIGTNSEGTAASPNFDGIFLGVASCNGASCITNGTRIGSSAPAERNLISGNIRAGITSETQGKKLTDTEISGNLIGTNAQGTAAIGNEDGVFLINVSIENLRIGVPGEGGGNVISGNKTNGLVILRSGGLPAIDFTIRNNRIGTNAAGTQAVPNGNNPSDPNDTTRSGIWLNNRNVQIGGPNPGDGNLISGNFNRGIYLAVSANNIIQGNLIGTDISGTTALGNFDGVYIGSSNFNTVGGMTAGARNVISGNRDDGVEISIGGNNTVQGNFIGTDASGTADLGNGELGVAMSRAIDNTIGGTDSGAGNRIAFNGEGGVFVAEDSTGNSILGNSIFSNTDLGINLFPHGVTSNDAGDPDTGANNLQNHPVLDSSANSGSGTTVSGTFNSTPSTQFRIEFFSSAACDPSGFGEGETFIGSQNVTTDAGGNAAINFTTAAVVSAGQYITATATDPMDNTSEFSACVGNQSEPADTVSPSVTINQAAGQPDLANGTGISIHFTAVFSEPVIGFGNSASDVALSGTAGANSFTVTEIAPFNGTTYDVAVSGMPRGGNVTVNIPANAAQDAANNPNTASASTDNTVTYVPNRPPTAVADSYSTSQDTPLSIPAPGVLGNDSDPDAGNTITAVLVTGPANAASFALNANGSFNYTPNIGFTGTDSFTYKAKDNFNAESNVVTVTLTVTMQYRFDWFYYSELLLRENVLNQVTAGSNVPVRFTLYGNKGIPYSQPPTSQQISCSTLAPIGAATTINRFAPDPYYSALYDFYQTTWQTQGAWKFTCRRLTLYLNDGTTKSLNFYFR